MAANSIGPKIQVDGVDSYYKDIQRIIQQGKNLGKQMEAVGNDFDNAGEKTSTFADVLKANLTSEAIISAVKNLGSALREVGAAVLDFVKDSVNVGLIAVGMTAAGVDAFYEGIKLKRHYMTIIGIVQMLAAIFAILLFIAKVVVV